MQRTGKKYGVKRRITRDAPNNLSPKQGKRKQPSNT